MATDRQNFYANEIYSVDFDKLNKIEKHRVDLIIQRTVQEMNTNSLQQEII